MNARHLLVLALVCGVVGGVVGYALASYVARIYVEITQPAAYVTVKDFRIDAAPYQTLSYSGIWIADVNQRSDRVEYRVRIVSENVELYKACIWAGYLTTTLFVDCGYELVFTVEKPKTMGGVFYIYVNYVHLRTSDKQGIITVEITCRPLP